MFSTPVLLLIFNRPAKTAKVMEVMKGIKPERLFVAADGPRQKSGELDLCTETRDIVLKSIDWQCDVQTLFRDKNLGCGEAVSSGISWFFDQVEEGIILEDDIVPDPSFFEYCRQLLEKYRDDEQVAMIGGNNNLSETTNSMIESSYLFSAYNAIWGWATWKRTWENYQYTLQSSEIENAILNLKDYYQFSKPEVNYWKYILGTMIDQGIDTWDYQLTAAIWGMRQLCIIPSRNLVLNIGFDHESTHTGGDQRFSSMRVEKVSSELIHPQTKKVVRNIDREISKKIFKISEGDIHSYWKYILKPRIKKQVKR